MALLRELRKSLTFHLMKSGLRGARRASGRGSVEGIRRTLRIAARLAVPLRRKVATNMRVVGFHLPGLVDAYFERAVDQYVSLAHVLRASGYAASRSEEHTSEL